MNKRLAKAVWVMCLIALSHLSQADELTDLITGKTVSEKPSTSDKIITINNSKHNDQKIRKRLQEIFAELDDLQDVKILARNGIVTLQGEVSSASTEAKALQFSRQVEGVVEVKNELVVTHSLEKRIDSTRQKLLKLGNQLIASLPLFLLALLIFVLAWMLGQWLSHRQNLYRRIAPNYFIASLLGQVTHLAFIVLGLVLALTLLDLTAMLGTILGAAGIVGLAVGFAVKDTVENYITSILLSLRNPFEINDLVKIDGIEGNVIRLTARATILLSPDGNHVRIPNSAVFKAVIINFSRNPERRFEFDIGIDTGQDILNAQKLALETLNSIEGVLSDPQPMVAIEDLGDSNIVMRIYGWMNQSNYSFLKVRSEAIRQIILAFSQADIVMPEPIYQIRISDEKSKVLAQKLSAESELKRAPFPPKPIDPTRTTATADITLDHTIKKKVEKEEAQGDVENLLDTSAPKE